MAETNEVLLLFGALSAITAAVAGVLGVLKTLGWIGGGGDGPVSKRVAMVVGALALVVIGVGTPVAFYRATRVPYVLSVDIVDKPSQPDRVLGSHQFQGVTGRTLSAEAVEEVATWIGTTVAQRHGAAAPLALTVRVPADPSQGAIAIEPAGAYTLGYEVGRGEGLGKLAPGKAVPPVLRQDFTLLVDRRGYETLAIPVVWGVAQDGTHTMVPKKIRLAIQAFDCAGADHDASEDERVLHALQARMSDDDRFVLYLYGDYSAEVDEIALNPMRQQEAAATGWELDLVIAGDFERV